MSEEVLINVTPQETRVAAVENGVLQELHIERTQSRGIVGNIYVGKVVRILPGMQAAFVEVGLERTAFLHAADIHLDSPLLNLDRYDGAPTEAFRSATRRAFDNLVDLAIEQQIRFMLIA